MKLLLDENLSRRIVPFLQSIFPESTQVALIGLEQADDSAINLLLEQVAEIERALMHENLACIQISMESKA